MARARNIKPGFFRNADLVELPFEARLLFIGLWTIADKAGRLEYRPKQIKMELFPADSLDCAELIGTLEKIGVVELYEVEGKQYLQVVNFAKHQNPHRDEKASTIPDKHGNCAAVEEAPKKHGANTVQAQCTEDANTAAIGLIPDSLKLIPDSLQNQSASEPTKHKEASASPVGFAEFWSAYPKKVAKGDAEKAWKKHKPDLAKCLAAIEAAKRSSDWQKDGGQFIPHPATWINGKRWEDGVSGVTAGDPDELITLPNGQQITRKRQQWLLEMTR